MTIDIFTALLDPSNFTSDEQKEANRLNRLPNPYADPGTSLSELEPPIEDMTDYGGFLTY